MRTKRETSIWEVRAVEGERVKKYPRQREENRGSEFQKVMDVIHGCPRRRLPSRMDVNGAVGERERRTNGTAPFQRRSAQGRESTVDRVVGKGESARGERRGRPNDLPAGLLLIKDTQPSRFGPQSCSTLGIVRGYVNLPTAIYQNP